MIAPDVLDLPPGEVAPLIRTELSDRTSLRIGLISDTHIPEARAELWPQVFDVFAGVDAILHGGDIHELFVLDQLAELAPLWSARGNGEDGSAGRSIAPTDPRLRYSWRLDLGGVHVGLTHDVPWPELDVLVFGDSHVDGIHQVGPTLCVNPGSPTYPRNLNTQLGTLGFLRIERTTVTAELWQLTDAGADGPTRTMTIDIDRRTADG